MAARPSAPRLGPLSREEMTADQVELLAGSPPFNIFKTLVRHPGLYRRWAPFGGKLLNGAKLGPRERELVILRVAWRCEAAYEWGQHVGIARDAGLTDEEILRVPQGPDAAGWTDAEAALLRAVDELQDDKCITDATWATLSSSLDELQLIELPMLAGHYALLAGALNSFGVQLDGDLPALGTV